MEEKNTLLEQVLEMLNSGRGDDLTPEMNACILKTCQEALQLTMELNQRYHTPEEIRQLMEKITRREVDPGFGMFPPFHTDFGANIHLGKNVFINSGCHFQDQGGIWIGDGALIGHNVVLETINHDMDPASRMNHYAPIRIGSRAWIGASAVILSGVTVGDDAVVAAGAVVTKNVAPGSVVGGVPAKVI